MRRLLRWVSLLGLGLALLSAGDGWAAGSFAEAGHFAFVISRGSTALTVIEIEHDQVAGQLVLPLTPSQIQVSASLPRLAAIDGEGARLALAKLDEGRVSLLPLDFPARRLLLSLDGRRVAVSDLSGGNVAVLDLGDGHQIGRMTGLPPLRDLMFGKDGDSLILAAERLSLVRLGEKPRELAASLPGGPMALTRSADARTVFARAQTDGAVQVIALDGAKPALSLPAKGNPIPSGTGAYLLLLDEDAKRLSIIHGGDFTLGAGLPAAAGLSTAYSAWFDSVAFVPSATDKTLLVYDLWRLKADGSIKLPAVAGAGAVTADSAKLYLPLPEAGGVAVIDARRHRLSTIIRMDSAPIGVAVAGAFGICH